MAENPVVTLARAYHFAAAAHVDQRRRGEAAEPYINRLTEVAELAATATRGTDPEIVIAAVLHDTVEDTAPRHQAATSRSRSANASPESPTTSRCPSRPARSGRSTRR